ncbi:hypothetical protein NQ317_018002, partial [Molorchus minor]
SLFRLIRGLRTIPSKVSATGEHISHDLTSLHGDKDEQGVVHDQPDSRVAVSACNGLSQAHHPLKKIGSGHKHLVYIEVSGNFLRIRRKTKRKEESNQTVEHGSLKYDSKRSVSSEHFVETLVVADSSMVEFHQDGDIEMYILTLFEYVELLEISRSLPLPGPQHRQQHQHSGSKIILLDDQIAEPDFNVTTNADTTLKTFASGNYR